jgi:hypothetical protein
MTEQSPSQQQWCGLPRAGAMLRGPAEDGRPAPHRTHRPLRRPSTYPCLPGIGRQNRKYIDHYPGIRYPLINRPRNRCNSMRNGALDGVSIVSTHSSVLQQASRGAQ